MYEIEISFLAKLKAKKKILIKSHYIVKYSKYNMSKVLHKKRERRKLFYVAKGTYIQKETQNLYDLYFCGLTISRVYIKKNKIYKV